MTDAKHTAGPWVAEKLDEDSASNERPWIHGANGGAVVALSCGYKQEEALVNAARIVACVNACEGIADPSVVPELVAALREVNAELSEYASITINGDADTRLKGIVERAEAILAKATGAAQ
jgi:hypothetical protein